jgi:hypothetical protein
VKRRYQTAPARRLYARLGYVEHEPRDGLCRMLLEL